MKSIKYFLIGFAIACILMAPAFATTLETALKDSEPNERGSCLVQHQKLGTLVMECVKGKRTDGATIFAILDDGEIVAVFEQSKKDEAPKKIWAKEWQET